MPDCRHCFPHIFSLHEMFNSAKDISEQRCVLAAFYSNAYLKRKPSVLRRTATLFWLGTDWRIRHYSYAASVPIKPKSSTVSKQATFSGVTGNVLRQYKACVATEHRQLSWHHGWLVILELIPQQMIGVHSKR